MRRTTQSAHERGRILHAGVEREVSGEYARFVGEMPDSALWMLCHDDSMRRVTPEAAEAIWDASGHSRKHYTTALRLYAEIGPDAIRETKASDIAGMWQVGDLAVRSLVAVGLVDDRGMCNTRCRDKALWAHLRAVADSIGQYDDRSVSRAYNVITRARGRTGKRLARFGEISVGEWRQTAGCGRKTLALVRAALG